MPLEPREILVPRSIIDNIYLKKHWTVFLFPYMRIRISITLKRIRPC